MTGRFGMLFGVVFFEFIFSSVKSMYLAYKITYLSGCIICLITTLLSILCLNKKKPPEGGVNFRFNN